MPASVTFVFARLSDRKLVRPFRFAQMGEVGVCDVQARGMNPLPAIRRPSSQYAVPVACSLPLFLRLPPFRVRQFFVVFRMVLRAHSPVQGAFLRRLRRR